MNDDEKFFAWLDGELAPPEAAEVEARVAADPTLAALAAQHRRLSARLKGAFDPVAEAPAPARLQSLLQPSNVVDLNAARRARQLPSLPQWAAMAATLAIGILVGTMVPQRSAAPVVTHDGQIYAASAIDRALDVQLASAPAGDVRVGLTFRDHAGEICRTFTAAASSGLACRDAQGWRLRGLFAAPEGQNGNYRMAAGMDPNLAALVDSAMAGDAFDAAAEKATKDKGWR